MMDRVSFNQSVGCPGPFWDRQTIISTCQRQRYVELFPAIVVLGACACLTVVCLLQELPYWIRPLKERESEHTSHTEHGHSRTHNRDGSTEPSNQFQFVEWPKGRTDSSAYIVIRGHSIADKLRLVAEFLLTGCELGFCLLSVVDKRLSRSFMEYAPDFMLVYTGLAAYTLGLVIYRILGVNAVRTLPGNPFFQCAVIYTLTMCVNGINWFSALVDKEMSAYSTMYLTWLIVAAVKWLVLFTSPMGDSSARLYTTPKSGPSPESTSSLLKNMMCSWHINLMFLASRRRLEQADVYELRETEHSYHIFEKYAKSKSNQHFILRLARCYKHLFILNVVYGLGGAALALLPAVFINLILSYVENPSTTPRPVAWLYVLGVFISMALQNTVENQAFYIGRRLSIIVRATVIGEIYQKALSKQVSSEDSSEKTADGDDSSKKSDNSDTKFDSNNTGAVMNLMSVDTFKISDFISYLHFIVGGPFSIFIAFVLLYRIMGWSFLAAVAVVVIYSPLNYYVAVKMGETQEKLMAMSDKRVEKTNEALSAIRIIKFFAWEHKFADQIFDLRDKELRILFIHYLWWGAGGFVFHSLPLLMTAFTFISYVVFEKKPLTSPVAFTALSIFNVLRYPIDDLAVRISEFMSCRVSVGRINEFLHAEESPKFSHAAAHANEGAVNPRIGFENATLSWTKRDNGTKSFKLRDLNVQFLEDGLNVIVGPTGAGKTSLLLGLLGEMHVEKGHVFLPFGQDRHLATADPGTGLTDTVAYCAQQAWLINDTVKNNILFAAPYDEVRYNMIVDACELRRDFGILAKGDQTLIGDKGITLSGGQKQRVSLARAFYSNSRYLILDDCLSAVDSHTAEALYSNALTGHIAQNRTVVVVSHNVALAVSKASYVVVMRSGRITAQGTPPEVSASGKLGQDDLILKNAQSSTNSRAASSTDLASKTKTPVSDDEEPDRTTQERREEEEDNEHDEETRGIGAIPLSTYLRYGKALGGTAWWTVFLIIVVLAPVAFYLQSWWLKHWSSSGDRPRSSNVYMLQLLSWESSKEMSTEKSLAFYASIYILSGLFAAIVATFKELIGDMGSVRASQRLFVALFDSVIRARTRFFDSTPVGRIVNRFSKDIETVDQQLMPQTLFFITCVMDALAVTIVVSYVTPAFIPAGVVIALAFYCVGKLYLECSRDLKRMESTSRSPIFQQFNETLAGVVTIRAYGDSQRFRDLNMNAVDFSHRPYFFLWLSNRWVGYWCFAISSLVTVIAAYFVVLNSNSLSSGTAGVSLAYSMMFGDIMLWVVRLYAQVAIDMNSVERIEEYIDIDHEAAAVIPESRPPPSWPSKGEVEFQDVSLRYSDDLPMVIKDVSFDIKGGTKVGIVGRTGAGKSTIMTSLFRMLEVTKGCIKIDGLDISTIGLYDLRNALAIIPQDPTLFSGTLRSNLDPFGDYTDDQIFTALARVKLVPAGTTSENAATHISDENPNCFLDLQSVVTEGGNNLSQGQRQILCLARSLLKSPRILLLDEATASIDYETDAMIQETIRNEFSDVTIITIAHRLRTIVDYDSIVVLEKGELAQFGAPAQLLQEKSGIFYSMCEKSGELDSLIQLASKSK